MKKKKRARAHVFFFVCFNNKTRRTRSARLEAHWRQTVAADQIFSGGSLPFRSDWPLEAVISKRAKKIRLDSHSYKRSECENYSLGRVAPTPLEKCPPSSCSSILGKNNDNKNITV